MMKPMYKLLPVFMGRSLILVCSLAVLLVLLSGLSSPVSAASLYQLTPFPTPTADADGKIFYIVQEGDTLWRIAAITGVTVDQLRALNKLGLDSPIVPGQKLLIGLGGPALSTQVPGGALPTAAAATQTPTPPPGWGILCVLLFHDQNGDSVHQYAEPAISGGAVSISNASGSFSKTGETTGSAPGVCFEEVPEGEYNVSVALPEGYNPTTQTNEKVPVLPGSTNKMSFGAQPNLVKAEEIQVIPSPSAPPSKKSPFLGILGGAILLIGLGLGVYAALLKRTGR
jgi:LysM domain/SdrD B-like domain